jgi:hypothetical protein
MEPRPKPERVWVRIPNAENKWTLHEYVRTEREPDPEYGDLAPQWAFIFRCAETGAERKYGVQDARPGIEAP